MDQTGNITPEILAKESNNLYKIKTIDIIQYIKEFLNEIFQKQNIDINEAEDYEILLRKHEAAIRQHIAIENQLKLYYEKLEEEINLLEKENKILIKNIEKQKKEINLFEEQIKGFKKVENNLIKKLKKKEKEIIDLNKLLKLRKKYSFKFNNSVYNEEISKESTKEKDIFAYFDNYFNDKIKKKSNNSLRRKNKNNTSLSLIERKYISKYNTNKNKYKSKKYLVSKNAFNNSSRNNNGENENNNYNNSKTKINENKYKTMSNTSSNKFKKINKNKSYNSRFAKSVFEKIGKEISEKYNNSSTRDKVMINLNTNIINTNLNIDKLNIDSKNKLNEYQKLINDKINEITRNNKDNKLKRTLSSLYEIIDDNNNGINKIKYIHNDIKKNKNKNYSISSSNIIIKNRQNINNLNKIQNYKNKNLNCNLRQNKKISGLLKKTNSMILNNTNNKNAYYSNINAIAKNQTIKNSSRIFKSGKLRNSNSNLKKIININKDNKPFLSLRKNIYNKIIVNSNGLDKKD